MHIRRTVLILLLLLLLYMGVEHGLALPLLLLKHLDLLLVRVLWLPVQVLVGDYIVVDDRGRVWWRTALRHARSSMASHGCCVRYSGCAIQLGCTCAARCLLPTSLMHHAHWSIRMPMLHGGWWTRWATGNALA